MSIAKSGTGVLRRVLEEARRELHCSRSNLTVLSTQVDLYRLDTPAGHRDGAWLAEQLERAVGAERRIHWRGLHYAIVAAGNIRKPNGNIYRNNDADWTWLANNAGKAARWLGYVDFQRIKDNRNSEPVREHAAYRLAELEAEIDSINEQLRMATGDHFDLPAIDIPAAEVDEDLARQASLVSSRWPWAEATRALISRKAYGESP